MHRAFVYLFLAASSYAATTVTDTLCGGNNAYVSWVRYDANGSQIGRVSPTLYTSGAYSQAFEPNTDGGRYVVTVTCPGGGTGSAGSWLIPDSVSTLTRAKVAVADSVRIDRGWYWDSSAEAWKNVAAGVSGGGGQIKQTFPYTFPPSSTAGATGYFVVPAACSISAVNILVDAGTATIKFWKLGTGTAIPTVANSINTNGVAISTDTAIRITNTADFITTNVVANDIVAVNLFAVATATMVHVSLECIQ